MLAGKDSLGAGYVATATSCEDGSYTLAETAMPADYGVAASQEIWIYATSTDQPTPLSVIDAPSAGSLRHVPHIMTSIPNADEATTP